MIKNFAAWLFGYGPEEADYTRVVFCSVYYIWCL